MHRRPPTDQKEYYAIKTGIQVFFIRYDLTRTKFIVAECHWYMHCRYNKLPSYQKETWKPNIQQKKKITQIKQPPEVMRTFQLIHHQFHSSYVQVHQFLLYFSIFGRNNNKHPVSRKEQIRKRSETSLRNIIEKAFKEKNAFTEDES